MPRRHPPSPAAAAVAVAAVYLVASFVVRSASRFLYFGQKHFAAEMAAGFDF